MQSWLKKVLSKQRSRIEGKLCQDGVSTKPKLELCSPISFNCFKSKNAGRSVRNSQHTAHFGQQQRSRMFASNTQKIALIEAGSENDPCKNCSGGGGSTSSGGTAQAISHVLRTLDMVRLVGKCTPNSHVNNVSNCK